jgi:tripartite-type tricarboxylate transporter receptor subunit TctC
MKLPRRNFLHLAAGAAALPAVPRFAKAQAYPTRPVRLMVGFPAGSTSDIYARLVGQWLSKRLAQPFVVENRPGAGGNIGTAERRSANSLMACMSPAAAFSMCVRAISRSFFHVLAFGHAGVYSDGSFGMPSF